MKKRGKQPAVSPEKAWEWLERFEKGETAPTIASKDQKDPRTVRKAINAAREQRDANAIRHEVLRELLREHFADLCNFAEQIKGELENPRSPGDIPLSLNLKDNPLWSALGEHLPGPDLARDLKRWEDVVAGAQTSLQFLRTRIEKETEEKTSLGFSPAINQVGILEDLFHAITFHAITAGHRKPGTESMSYTEESSELEGTVIIRLGGRYNLACVPQEQSQEIQKLLGLLIKEATGWSEAVILSSQVAKGEKIRKDLIEKLTGIILRKAVPGRCKFCPC